MMGWQEFLASTAYYAFFYHLLVKVRFKVAGVKAHPDTIVNTMTLHIDDDDNKCPGYINKNGEFDIGIQARALIAN